MAGSTEAYRQSAAQEPDIYVTNAEMLFNKSSPTACMTINGSVLEPAKCYSKTGISSMKIFAGNKSKQRPQSAQTLQAYAALFDKYYGGESIIDRLVAQSNSQGNTSASTSGRPPKPRPASASAAVEDRTKVVRHHTSRKAAASAAVVSAEEAARLDEEIEQRAGRSGRAKYLTPYLATKYNVAVEGLVQNPVLNPAVQGLTMVPTGGLPKDVALTHADMQGAAKVLELAATLQEAERQKAAKAAAVRKRNAKVTAARVAAPRPASSSFKTTSREQAQNASVRTASGNAAGPMGPGQYNSGRYYMYMQPHTSTPRLEPRQYTQAPRADAGHDYDNETIAFEATAGPGPASAAHNRPVPGKQHLQSQQKDTSAGRQGSGTAGRPSSAPVLPIFKDAHRVHPRKPAPDGSSSFKAPPRPHIDATSTAGHLACTYFREDYDAFLQKPPKLVTKFQDQVARPAMMTPADTPEALGPGVYIRGSTMPTSLTGAHVSAGHKHVRHALSFANQTVRPGSAPPSRPAAGDIQPPVSWAQGAAALTDMYGPSGADLDPSVLVSIRALEQAAEAGPGGYRHSPYPSTAKSRPASAALGAPVAAAGAGTAPGVPTVLGQQEVAKYSSTGLAKRVPGGRISLTTRAAETMGLRAMSRDGIIPPASGPLRMGAGADVSYEPDDSVQGHRQRVPAWKLPANRNAQSQTWIAAAALSFIQDS